MSIDFISSKDVDKECLIHTTSDNKELITYDKASDIVVECFNITEWFLYVVVHILSLQNR